VKVDGAEVPVANEKASLTTLGRDELLDDKISKMAVLSRTAGEVDELPTELRTPLAVATHLLNTPALVVPATIVQDTKDNDVTSSESSPAASDNQPSDPTLSSQGQITNVASGGLLGLFNSYSAPLSRFAATATWKATKASPTSSALPSPSPSSPTSRRPSSSFLKLPGTLNDVDNPPASIRQSDILAAPMISLPMVVIIALIAFLIGSLLRSLLSPADFIYVVTDLRDVEHTTGWREIKRLLEVKYILGGWDFQIAMVRRH